jgi:hypothetical protein
MKKMKLLLLGLIVSSNSFSQVILPEVDYHCKKVFEARVKKLEKSSKRRVLTTKVLKSSIVLGTAIPGMAIIVATGGGSLVLGGFMSMMIGAAPASMGIVEWVDNTEDNKLNKVLEAMSLQELMYMSEADFMRLLEEEKDRELKKRLVELDNQMTHPKALAELVKEKNEKRLKKNERALSESEAIEEARTDIKKLYSYEVINNNSIMTNLKKLKKEGRVHEDLKYDEFRQILINEQDQFCLEEETLSSKKFFAKVFPKNK